MKQHTTIDQRVTEKEIAKEFLNRLKVILRTDLKGWNITKAINTYANPLVVYSFGILQWTSTGQQEMDRRIRTLMTQSRKHHPKSCKERINIPVKLGYRDITDFTDMHDKHFANLRRYFVT